MSKGNPVTKVLIVTYYWPPSGGMAVQRWMNLANGLAQSGVEVFVLTIDETSAFYPVRDESLWSRIDSKVHVTRVKAWNPFVLAKKVMKSGIPSTGFASGEKERRLNWISFLRSHLFIPDPRKTWNRRAVRMATQILKENQITNVVTTSPPASVHLIGRRLKQNFDIQWIADFRDPWTDIFYYDRLGHSRFSRWIDLKLEKSVLQEADLVVAVSTGCVELLKQKLDQDSFEKFLVISNGFDHGLSSHAYAPNQGQFQFVFTGSIADSYQAEAFFDAIDFTRRSIPECSISVEVYGPIPVQIQNGILEKYDCIAFHGEKSHSEIRAIQEQADALFLVAANAKNYRGMVAGKLFEYLRAMRPIVHLGNHDSDVAQIIRECNAGVTFNRAEGEGLAVYCESLVRKRMESQFSTANVAALSRYDRKNQMQTFLSLMESTEVAGAD